MIDVVDEHGNPIEQPEPIDLRKKHKKKNYIKIESPSVPPSDFDFDGSRPGIQKGPSAAAVVWMGARRLAKFATSAGIGYLVVKAGGSIPEAVQAAGGYMVGEKISNETIHKITGKPADIDPLVLLLEFLKSFYLWFRNRKKGGNNESK